MCAKVPQGGGYPAGGGFRHEDDEDFRGAAEAASRHAGDSGDAGMFGGILNAIGQRKGELANEDIDEGRGSPVPPPPCLSPLQSVLL